MEHRRLRARRVEAFEQYDLVCLNSAALNWENAMLPSSGGLLSSIASYVIETA